MFRLTIFLVVSGLQFLVYTRARRWARARFPGSPKSSVLIGALFGLFSVVLLLALFMGPLAGLFPRPLLTIAKKMTPRVIAWIVRKMRLHTPSGTAANAGPPAR